jgi:hypothetical protein
MSLNHEKKKSPLSSEKRLLLLPVLVKTAPG